MTNNGDYTIVENVVLLGTIHTLLKAYQVSNRGLSIAQFNTLLKPFNLRITKIKENEEKHDIT